MTDTVGFDDHRPPPAVADDSGASSVAPTGSLGRPGIVFL